MTSLEKSLYDDVKRYEYAVLAGRLAQSEEGQPFIHSALEKLMSSLNEDAALSTSVAIQHGGEKDIIDGYTGKYQRVLNSISISEYLKGEGVIEKAKERFGEFFNEKYEIINKKIEGAKYIIDGIKKGKYKFPEREKEKAKKDILEYGAIYLLINALETRKFNRLRGEVTSEDGEKSIDGIIKEPEKYVKNVFAEYLNMNHEKESYKKAA